LAVFGSFPDQYEVDVVAAATLRPAGPFKGKIMPARDERLPLAQEVP
jgi:hypothetical protein